MQYLVNQKTPQECDFLQLVPLHLSAPLPEEIASGYASITNGNAKCGLNYHLRVR